jgi:hypothetical protein
MSQMGNQLSQREKGTFPSQPVINLKDPRAAPSTSAQINAIHTLRSGKEVDNNIQMPQQSDSPPSSSTFVPSNPSSSPSSLDRSKGKESEPITIESTYEPRAPFPNRLKPKKKLAHVEKILEIFKQVKVNVPLLDAIEQVPNYAKVLKDLCTKKRAATPKKVFLAANISGILSN